MALTPEDVVNKHFSVTHLRRGYDEDEVDDFLDEVVAEFRRLLADNADLGTKLDECRKSARAGGAAPAAQAGGMSSAEIAQLRHQLAEAQREAEAARRELGTARQDATGARDELASARRELLNAQQDLSQTRMQVQTLTARVAAAEQSAKPVGAVGISEAVVAERVAQAQREAEQRMAGVRAELDRSQAENKDLGNRLREAQQRAEEATRRAEEAARRAQEPPQPAAGLAGSPHDPDQAASVIALAQRLHDQHVQEGTDTKARLVREGQETHDTLIAEGQKRHDQLVNEGQSRFDELVRSGQSKHDELVTAGKSRYDELVTTGQTRHDELVSSATNRHESLIKEAEDRRSAVLTDLNTQQTRLTAEIEDLRSRRETTKERLRAFMAKQLADLDGDGKPDAMD